MICRPSITVARAVIERVGASLMLFLPYSPYFNPFEQIFS